MSSLTRFDTSKSKSLTTISVAYGDVVPLPIAVVELKPVDVIFSFKLMSYLLGPLAARIAFIFANRRLSWALRSPALAQIGRAHV